MRTSISLYTGVGGLDFGFEAAGFRTAVAVEYDAIACRTIRLNRDWPVLEHDIHTLTSEAILKEAGLNQGEADVLIGGPPCQPFSKAGYWARGDAQRLSDPRAQTLSAFLRVLGDTQPKTFLLENVSGLIYRDKDEGLAHLLEGIQRINKKNGTRYKPCWKKLNAADYGVPQFRERVFLVGARDGRSFDFPEPLYGKSARYPERGEPYRTAWDAIGDLPRLPNEPGILMGGKWAELLPTIPEGENYLWHTSRGGGMRLFGWRTRYWSFLLKLAKDRPSWTIQAQPGSTVGPFHWCNRKLSAKELCRLQTLPDNLRFDCGRTDLQKMLGNAVPSALAESIARAIRVQLLDDHEDQSKSALIPSVRSPMPQPEPVASLPVKYLHLIDEHADHPGEGLGRGARRVAEKTTKLS